MPQYDCSADQELIYEAYPCSMDSEDDLLFDIESIDDYQQQSKLINNRSNVFNYR
jgi:hypothetical protein